MTKNSTVDYKSFIKKGSSQLTEALGDLETLYAELGGERVNDARIARAATGLGIMRKLLKAIKNRPETKEAIKQLKESTKLLEKQLRLLTTDETINATEYSHKLHFSSINGINQVLHLYYISTESPDLDLLSNVFYFLRTGENVYQISEELARFSKSKQAWAGK